MHAWYVLSPDEPPTGPAPTYLARAEVLGATPLVDLGDSYGITDYPTVVVTSTVLSPVVIADTAGQATEAEVANAKAAAETAESTRQAKIAAAMTSLQGAVGDLAPGLVEGQDDLATLAGRPSTTPLAPILHRVVTRLMVTAQGIADLLVVLELVEPTEV